MPSTNAAIEYLLRLPPRFEQDYVASRVGYLIDKLDLVKELNIENHQKVKLLDRVLLTEMFKE